MRSFLENIGRFAKSPSCDPSCYGVDDAWSTSFVYQRYIYLEQVWVSAVALGPTVILGTWAAKRVTEQSS